MRKKYLHYLTILLLLLSYSFSFGQSGIYEGYVIVNVNNSGNYYYDLEQTPNNASFDGQNLGSFNVDPGMCTNTSNDLILNGGQNKIYKCGSDDILDGTIYYRVYPTGSPSGAFIPLTMAFSSNDGGATCGGILQTWGVSNSAVNLLSGLTAGNYTIEVYTQANFTYATGNGTHYMNNPDAVFPNTPQNYKATFIVVDTTAPTASNPATINVQCLSSVPAPDVLVVTDEADNCGTPTVTFISQTANPLVNDGTIIRTYRVNDGNGNTIDVTQNIVIDDTTAPTASNPTDITVQCLADVPATNVLVVTDEADNCGTATVTFISQTANPLVNDGTIVRTYRVDDGNGNTIDVTQKIIIDDTTPPATPILNDVIGQCTATATIPTTTDNCAGIINGTTTDPLTYSTQGTHIIHWTFNDGNGQSIIVNQNVVIKDTTPTLTPTLADVTGQCTATATIPTTTDACAGIINGTTSDPLTYSTQGTHIIHWTFNDGNGQSISVNQNVIINDITPPATPILNDVIGQCTATATIPTTTDNCAGIISGTTADPLTSSTQGTHIIHWTFNDGNGQSINVNQNVFIDDTTAPTITAPTPTSSTTNLACTSTNVILGSPIVADNCTATASLIVSNDAPAAFPIGTTTVTWSVKDAANNSQTATQLVTVTDNVKPTITAPTPTSGTTNLACTSTNVILGSPIVADNCTATASLIVSNDAPATFPIGTTTVTWSVKDADNNSQTATQLVTVTDNVKPTLTAITNKDENVGASCSFTIPNYTSLTTAADNCTATASIIKTQSPINGTVISGNNTSQLVTITADDGNGNTQTTTFTVTLKDVTPPIAKCQNISVTLDASGNATITASQINNVSTDNCGIQSLLLSKYTFDCTNLGANTVRLTAIDDAGNSSYCDATVTILDPAANAKVSILSNDANNEICIGENITFTATPVNGGTTPIYEWFVDGVSNGTNNPIFTPFTPLTVGTHTIYVRIRSSLSACVLPKQSNTISVTVDPLPVVSAPAQICMGSSGNLSPNVGGTWTSSNINIATINSAAGTITPVSPGSVTFTFQSTATTCSRTTNTVTINALPVIGNYPTNNKICKREIYTSLTPNSGGTWSSSDTNIATITNAGIITGINPGNVSFIFTNSVTTCSTTSNPIEVLAIPTINSITATPTIVCSGSPSILTVNATGAAIPPTVVTLVNYDFNSGSNYGNLNGNNTGGVTSTITSSNITFDRTQTGNASIVPPAYITNTAGTALKQFDDWDDGAGNLNGSDDSGNWDISLTGTSLYGTFKVYFDAKRQDAFGDNKTIKVQYRVNNTGAWINTGIPQQLNINSGTTNWQTYSATLPGTVANPNSLQFRLSVDDGSTYARKNGNYTNKTNPHVLIDNFQIQAQTTTVPETLTYSWTADTGANAGLPAGAGSPSANNKQITVNPAIATNYTVSVANTYGCPVTQAVNVGVYAVPTLNITANYCPAAPNQNKVALTANGVGFTSLLWNTGETAATIYVDIAGAYQVIGTTANNCTVIATINVAQELVVNGDFEQGNNNTFGTDYTYRADVHIPQEWVPRFGNGGSIPYYGGELYDDTIGAGYVNGYSITTDGNNVHSNFHGTDHTSGTGNFMAVNGHGTQYVVWSQTVNVEIGSVYYFSAWARSLNNVGPFGKLRFRVNGVQVGIQLDLASYPTKDWDRFYGTWPSTTTGSILIEIVNNEPSFGGNDFGIDDISFGTLSTFITLTSAVGTDHQTVCQNTPITDITYNVGGGLSPPTISGLPAGLTKSFDGLEIKIIGTPTQSGSFTYTIDTNASCGSKTAQGTMDVNPEPIVTLNTLPQTVCQYQGTIPLQATLSGSASGGTWSISGTPIATNIAGNSATATYTIGATTGAKTFTFTSNDPAGPCGAAIKTVDFIITPYIIANAGPDQTTGECNVTTVTLASNNVTGQWTASPNTGYFSDASVYNSKFTGESGTTYTLTWTATNDSPCANTSDTAIITIPNCGNNLVFDGIDDNVSFVDNYGLSGSFSIEAWIKPNTVTGTQTIISKRNSANLNSGYDFSLIADRLHFRWNGIDLFANYTMNNTKWYHVAVTFSGSQYQIYIDGFPVSNVTNGTSPLVNTNKALIGAMDTTNNKPANYFGGGIDEVRIWNTALTQTQIQGMMNQEIKANGNAVSGVVVPLDINGLQWNNLIGYYQMKSGPQSNVANGIIQDISTASPTPGKLNNMTTNQVETAPIPYVSGANNDWDNQNTWQNGTVQQIPNSKVNSITGTEQTWNIVKTENNITTNRPVEVQNKTVVLGLLLENNRLSITNDQPLYVNNYLNIENAGVLDLVGESQLLQPEGSIVGVGTGVLEIDQQGQKNSFNYNYWSSPVSNPGVANNSNYMLATVLKDGTTPSIPLPINFGDSAYFADTSPASSPIKISNRWIWSYNAPIKTDDWANYTQWNYVGSTGSLKAGEGYTMKGTEGTALITATQNYVFIGKPNSGTITLGLPKDQTYLVGNPYPSALDADEFIKDNLGGRRSGKNIFSGALYFWDHFGLSNNHLLAEYQGGYATYTLMGGVAGIANDPLNVNNNSKGSKIPKRYISVAQGFFVDGYIDSEIPTSIGLPTIIDGGDLIFKNSQRVFAKESSGSSIFMKTKAPAKTKVDNSIVDTRQKIRLGFDSSLGAHRQLLVGVDPNTTNLFDIGYDALMYDTDVNDMYWEMSNSQFVIQGVPDFNSNQIIPLGILVANEGGITVKIDSLENIPSNTKIYLYDKLTDKYNDLTTTDYKTNLAVGDYNNRFSLRFSNQTLSVVETESTDGIDILYSNNYKMLIIRNRVNGLTVNSVALYNTLGQYIANWDVKGREQALIQIPIKDLPTEIYIVKIKTTKGEFSKKIIVK